MRTWVASTLVVAAVATLHGSAASASHGQASAPAVLYELDGALWAVAVDGSRRVLVTQLRGDGAALSADRSRVAYNNAAFELMTMRLDEGDRRRVAEVGGGDLAWAPNGRAIFFVRYREPRENAGYACGAIFRVDVVSGRVRRVTAGYTAQPRFTRSDEDPAISPDGRRIAYTDWVGCGEGGTSYPRLRVVDIHGRPTRDLAQLQHEQRVERMAPAWSPDGDRIAFRTFRGDVVVANRDGSRERRLVRGAEGYFEDAPAWSADAEWLAFTRRTRTEHHVVVVRTDGTGLRRVARTRIPQPTSPTFGIAGWLPSVPK